MQFLHQPLLGTIQEHAEAGAVCAGTSLAPISPAVAARFTAIGSGTVIGKAEAEAALTAVTTGPCQIMGRYLGVLESLAKRATEYVAEANTLFPVTTGADEATSIAGMAEAIRTARPALPDGLFGDVEFLRSNLHGVVGIDPAPIALALDALDGLRSKIEIVDDEIDDLVRQLGDLQEQARAPESLMEARKRRVATKAARVLPGLVAEIRALHGQAVETVTRLEKTLAQIEGVS